MLSRLADFGKRLLYSREDELILACVRSRSAPESTRALLRRGMRWDKVISRSAHCRVSPWVYFHLKSLAGDSAVPSEALDRLRDVITCQFAHLIKLSGMLEEIVERFSDEGIEVIVLKGVALAAAVYDNPGFRMTGDLDVMVSRDDVAAAAQLLGGLGCKQKSTTLSSNRHHLPVFYWQGDLSVELHWDIVSPAAPHTIPTNKLWARCRPLRIGTAETRMLGPEHLLLHTALHAAYGHSFHAMLFQLCDIREIVCRFADEIDWDFLLAQIKETSIEWPAYWSFRMAVDLTGATIPPHILKELKPPYARWSPRYAILIGILPRVALSFEGTGFLTHAVSDALWPLVKENTELIAWSKVARRVLDPARLLRYVRRLYKSRSGGHDIQTNP